MAEFEELGNLTHHIESSLEVAAQNPAAVDKAYVAMVVKGQDEINHLIDAIRDGESYSVSEQFVAEIDQSRDKLLGKSTAEAPAVQTPKKPEKAEAKSVEKGKDKKQTETARKVSAKPGEMQSIKVVPFLERLRAKQQQELEESAIKDTVRISAELLDGLVNLAGESSIFRSRLEQQVGLLRFNVEEMSSTVTRLRQQLRNLEIETEAQVLYGREVSGSTLEEFDPLEFDRYTRQQELTRSLSEAASDLLSLKDSLEDLVGDAEATLVQQGRANSELQEGLMRTRLIPFSSQDSRLRRMVRQISRELKKDVDLKLHSVGEMDRTVLERMVAPIEHMLRNAIDHGIESKEARKKLKKPETGKISIELYRKGSDVHIEIQDDGRGLDTEAIRKKAIEKKLISPDEKLSAHDIHQMILLAGFSTASEVTQISGRGVGMDVVYNEIKQLGGALDIISEEEKGTKFSVRLPFTVSVNQALMVNVKNETYAIPLNNIVGVARALPEELEKTYQSKDKTFKYAGEKYDLRYLGQVLDPNSELMVNNNVPYVPIIIIKDDDQNIALHADELLVSREIVVKSVGNQLSAMPGISGATILGDGQVVLILDLPALSRRFGQLDDVALSELQSASVEDKLPTVMVVDDSITVRKVTARLLKRNNFEVLTAKDGVDAMTQLHDVMPDVMLLDIEMPRMDGFELATIVRHDERLKDLPIIMITSRTGQKHRERAESIGVNDYLGKPYDEATVLGLINGLLEKADEAKQA